MKKPTLLLALFISLFSYAQNEVTVDLSSPKATVYTHMYFLESDNYEPKKAAQTIQGFEGNEAIQQAIKLKRILDGKGLKVDFTKIPSNPNYIDSTSVSKTNIYTLFPYQMPEVTVEKVGNQWYYSLETCQAIDDLYAAEFLWHTEKLQELIPTIGHYRVFHIELWQYAGLIALIIINIILFYIIKFIVFFTLKKLELWIVHRSNESINKALEKLARPIVLLILMWFSKLMLPSLFIEVDVNRYLFLGLNIMEAVFWIYVFLKLVSVAMSIYASYADATENKLDDQLVPILNNFLTGIVVFIGLLKLLTLFGIEPGAVIAGASIGGLAVALASQDTVKNLIGTLMIFLDKPFQIGDFINAGEVSGTVEAVGFRSTRVRAADTSLFQIPNSKLSEMVVKNMGLRTYRRYTTELGVRYDTPPELIEAFVTGIRKIIELQEATRDDAFNVEFSGFGASSLNIMVNVYFNVDSWNIEQSAKHELHMKILKLATALGVEFAFPSTTMYVEDFPEKTAKIYNYNTEESEIRKIIDEIK